MAAAIWGEFSIGDIVLPDRTHIFMDDNDDADSSAPASADGAPAVSPAVSDILRVVARHLKRKKQAQRCMERMRVKHMFFNDGTPSPLAQYCATAGLSFVVVLRLGDEPLLLWAGSERAFFLAEAWGKIGAWSDLVGVEHNEDGKAVFKGGRLYPSMYVDARGSHDSNYQRFDAAIVAQRTVAAIVDVSEKVSVRLGRGNLVGALNPAID